MGGVLAAITVPVIWAIWLTATRAGVTGGLSALDAGLLRFVIPAVVLLPVAWKSLPAYREAGLLRCLLIVWGAGAPFFMIAATGMKQVPMADIGSLMPGTMPIFVMILAALVDRRLPSIAKLMGVALVLGGVLLFLAPSLIGGGQWQGQVTVMSAACCWAVYTLAYRNSGLSPWAAAALISSVSGVLFLGAAVHWGSHLLEVPTQTLLWQLAIQGVLTGLVSLAVYGVAVARLGAGASLYGALTPAIAALLAIPVLGEYPSVMAWLGLGLITLGVIFAVRPQAVRT
ncbi:DMT family transporter [Lacibacterium aquatile]|uniref:DMT family transporter n=1 Tax=Lacibacterium aquatile TaxID=1168082 RepID=A0ABW5DUZ0_9PROT